MINVNVVIATLGAVLLAAMISDRADTYWIVYAALVFLGALVGCLVGHKRDSDLGVAAVAGALIAIMGAPLALGAAILVAIWSGK
jgi:asparagine N-glycosylation enzyme membrane subunit Stt3